jgi:hypothetical protein
MPLPYLPYNLAVVPRLKETYFNKMKTYFIIQNPVHTDVYNSLFVIAPSLETTQTTGLKDTLMNEW